MTTEYFTDENSIVRRIWGKSDTILFIFAGASAEFALNKAVDWLYFTGRLPNDPLGRLFSTVSYAKAIVFSEKQAAIRAINAMSAIHGSVEKKREQKIPDWAYRDVLFMLVDYSIRAFEVLERKMTSAEKAEVFNVFHRMGSYMELKGLPENFTAWEKMREEHLHENLLRSHYTDDLFKQYRKHLGAVRYKILLEAQALVAPSKVKSLLQINTTFTFRSIVALYKLSRIFKIDFLLKELILPSQYKKDIKALDNHISQKRTSTSSANISPNIQPQARPAERYRYTNH